MHVIHSRGILHGDLKSVNILIDDQGFALVRFFNSIIVIFVQTDIRIRKLIWVTANI